MLGFELVRAKLIRRWGIRATELFAPSYFAFPIVGPLICGTLGGCGGLVMMGGLEVFSDGPNWLIVSAFFAAAAFTFLPTLDVSVDQAHLAVSLFLALTPSVAAPSHSLLRLAESLRVSLSEQQLSATSLRETRGGSKSRSKSRSRAGAKAKKA